MREYKPGNIVLLPNDGEVFTAYYNLTDAIRRCAGVSFVAEGQVGKIVQIDGGVFTIEVRTKAFPKLVNMSFRYVESLEILQDVL